MPLLGSFRTLRPLLGEIPVQKIIESMVCLFICIILLKKKSLIMLAQQMKGTDPVVVESCFVKGDWIKRPSRSFSSHDCGMQENWKLGNQKTLAYHGNGGSNWTLLPSHRWMRELVFSLPRNLELIWEGGKEMGRKEQPMGASGSDCSVGKQLRVTPLLICWL